MADRTPHAVFGGTFDPIHYGHLRLAQEMAEMLGLEKVRLIPAGQPPHRGTPTVAPKHRLEMVRLAAEDNPLFEVDGREIQKPAPSYSVETLAELRAELGPERPLVLLLGADAFLGLATWHRWEDLFDLAHIAVAQRPGYAMESWATAMPLELRDEWENRLTHDAADIRSAAAGKIIARETTRLDISATRIRLMAAGGKNPRYLLPDAVLDYIRSNHLYL
jgi:nicotinate (nicotinamide) nucleotide adenylyltransferase